jgi:hypothetical protein
LGYPASEVKARLESKQQKVLARFGQLQAVDEARKLFELDLDALPRPSDRLHIFVEHTDGNQGDFEAGVRRRPSRC